MSFEIRERFALEPWQNDAVTAWLNSDHSKLGPRHGILDIYTGAGKTVVALGAMATVAAEHPATKFAVVVPTIALAQQWVEAVVERTTLPRSRIGMVGGDQDDSFHSKDVVVYVLASARAQAGAGSQLARDCRGRAVMLIVDECHKAGAQSSSRIFDAETTCRLGLSATPQREGADSQDDLGQVLPLERQRHGRALGGICFRLGLRDGYRRGMLPRYEIHHHGISLTGEEQAEYATLSHRVTQARQSVSRCGGSPDSYLAYLTGRAANASAALRSAASALQSAYLERKHFLYQASERLRVVERILVEAWRDERLGAPRGAVLFNERIGDSSAGQEASEDDPAEQQVTAGAESLTVRVKSLASRGELPFSAGAVALEHSRKTASEREAALAGLRDGSVQVLVSVKALQEGIDIPDVGLGVSVASTASARQRIQTMGRILRPARDERGRRVPADEAPVKRLHLLYVRSTVDEEIYKRTDWNDETGADRNHWWSWELASETPLGSDGLSPTGVDETSAWERVENLPLPQPWEGPSNALPLVYKGGKVLVITGSDPIPVSGAKEMIALLEAGKKRGAYADARGRFKVTTGLHVVLKRGFSSSDPSRQIWLAVGRLEHEPTWAGKGEDSGESPAAESPTRSLTQSKSRTPSKAPSSSKPTASSKPLARSTPMASAHSQASAPSATTNTLDTESGQLGARGVISSRTKELWTILVQEGFLAAVHGDSRRLKTIRELLCDQKRSWATEAIEILMGTSPAAEAGADESPPTSLETLLPFVASAHVNGRADLVSAASEKFPIGKAKKPARLAMKNALAILNGTSEQIWRPTK